MTQQWENVLNKVLLTQGELDDEVYFGKESKKKKTKNTERGLCRFQSSASDSYF